MTFLFKFYVMCILPQQQKTNFECINSMRNNQHDNIIVEYFTTWATKTVLIMLMVSQDLQGS